MGKIALLVTEGVKILPQLVIFLGPSLRVYWVSDSLSLLSGVVAVNEPRRGGSAEEEAGGGVSRGLHVKHAAEERRRWTAEWKAVKKLRSERVVAPK